MVVKFDPKDVANALAHIEKTWAELTIEQKNDEGTLVGLPYPYIIPSYEAQRGFAFRELYYWDSFFVMRGLIAEGRTELAEGILENILYLYRRFHIVPNASRFYMTSRSQPPIMTSMIFDIYEEMDKSDAWLMERLKVAEREYHGVWMSDQHPNLRQTSTGLSRYYDINYLHDLAEAESGWDMTTRYGGRCLDFNPVDLNSLLYIYEKDFARGYKIFGDEDTSDLWNQKAAHRAEIMNQRMWDNKTGIFYDFNHEQNERGSVLSLATYFPMWAGFASQSQAEKLVKNLDNFLHEGGLGTTSTDNVYAPRPINKQWAHPNGWAPLHWVVCRGLENYGYKNEAEKIAKLWINTNLQWYKNTGVFKEAYNVVDIDLPQVEGVYPSQVGFGWTNAVFIEFAQKYLSDHEKLLI